MKRIITLLVIIGLAVLALALSQLFSDHDRNDNNADSDQPRVDTEPVDAVMDFFQPWLGLRASNTNPYDSDLLTSAPLSERFRTYVHEAEADFVAGISDPVLCAYTLPEKLRTKTILHQDTTAQVLLFGKEEQTLPRAVIYLVGNDGEWNIDRVDCNAGEVGPELGAFSFERSGYLLKDSVQPPLDPNTWYLVYEEDGLLGFTAALIFTENSSCTALDGSSLNCPDALFETMHVAIKGNISEAGVAVVELNTLPE